MTASLEGAVWGDAAVTTVINPMVATRSMLPRSPPARLNIHLVSEEAAPERSETALFLIIVEDRGGAMWPPQLNIKGLC